MVKHSIAYKAGELAAEATIILIRTTLVVNRWGLKAAIPYVADRTAQYVAPRTKLIFGDKYFTYGIT